MGDLVVKKYPTKLFLDLADHTYVECGTGAVGWSCWGGKTGGKECKRGTGSTKQANCIAKPNERAGITCYLINGVCHQAANRIIFPAGITLEGAGVRGYGLSSSIFGVYGRVSGPFGTCSAPFDQCTGVTGDLPECAAPPTAMKAAKPAMTAAAKLELASHAKYLRTVRSAYAKFDAASAMPLDKMKFHADLFDHHVKFRLGADLGDKARKLRNAKEHAELAHRHIAGALGDKIMKPAAFIKAFNDMTHQFQDDVAATLNKTQYKKLLDVDRDKKAFLADPEIIRTLYGEDTVKEAFGALANRKD